MSDSNIFAGLTVYHSSTQFGQGTGPILFTNIGCSGTESTLLECSRSVFGVTSCTHSRDVGVKCEGIATVNVYHVHSFVGELPYLVKAYTLSHMTVCEIKFVKRKSLIYVVAWPAHV